MGVETGRAIRARQRETAARIDRLIARSAPRDPDAGGCRERIRAAVREGQLALRARTRAELAIDDAERRLGGVLVRMTAEGMSEKDAFAALGLSKWTGRRLIGLGGPVSLAGTEAAPSTGWPVPDGIDAAAGHGGPGAAFEAPTSELDTEMDPQPEGRS